MKPQRMAEGNAWMLEVFGRIAAHPEPLHDPPRRLVEPRGEGDDLVQAELLEAVGDRSSARLGCIAAGPQCSRASRQPTSTAGVKCSSKLGRARPTKPMKLALPATSTAHSPQPSASICLRARSASASLSSRDGGAGK